MTNDPSRAIVPRSPGSVSIASRLAERTLAERADRGRATIKVLIVDDIRETRDYLAKVLAYELDIEVVGLATTGIEALELAPHLYPDVILMDIMMPEMSGLAATEILLETMPEVAVVMMSVVGDADYLRRAARAGAREFLIKPFGYEELTSSIREVSTRTTPRIRGYGTGARPGDVTDGRRMWPGTGSHRRTS